METKHGLNCYECGKAYEAKRSTSKYCSGACRKLAFQKDKVSVPENGKNAKSENGKVSVLEHQDSAQIRHERDFVSDAGITGGMSRETLTKIDTACGDNISGQPDVPSEQTAKTPSDEARSSLTPAMLYTLPVGVARPTGQPNERTRTMTGENLNRRLIGVKVWQQTPEYAEVVHRLLTGKTEGMSLPTWVVA